jgi:hypothetical protein
MAGEIAHNVDPRNNPTKMIDTVSSHMRDWIVSVTNGVRTDLLPPRPSNDETLVSLHLCDLLRAETQPTPKAQYLKMTAKYLVTVHSDDPIEAHRLLGTILLATSQVPDYEAEIDAVPPAVWQAYGVPPQAGFYIKAPVIAPKTIDPSPRVTQPPEAVVVAMAVLRGRIIGPDGLGIARAKVSIKKLRRSTFADHKGDFVVEGIAAGERPYLLEIAARGIKQSEEIIVSNTPITIEFNPGVN